MKSFNTIYVVTSRFKGNRNAPEKIEGVFSSLEKAQGYIETRKTYDTDYAFDCKEFLVDINV